MKLSLRSPVIYPIIVPANNPLQSYNFYLIKNENTLFLLDAGEDSEACWEYLNRSLQEINAKITDLDAIILTHNHADHIGLVNRIRLEHDLPVYAHPNAFVRLKRDSEFLQARAAFFEELYKKMGSGVNADEQSKRI